MKQFYLLGEHLSHSYSPQLHKALGNDAYSCLELRPEELGPFLQNGQFDGLNVTIPYKKAVLPYCAKKSAAVNAIGSANTIIKLPDGSLYADNTDAFGLQWLIRRSGISVSGKKALVLGSGGAGVCARYVLSQMGADVTVISRSSPENYENLSRHRDARILLNATPVGMYPNNGSSPLDLGGFPHLEAVFDLIYNPARTSLMLQAKALGIPAFGGLSMLTAQAARSSELFTGRAVSGEELERITARLRRDSENLILIGMPGCGKTTVGRILAARTGREFYDCDEMLTAKADIDIPTFFRENGEEAFRRLETECLRELGKRSGCVIATGGGCVTRPENEALLRQNGRILLLTRPMELLSCEGRPLSMGKSVYTLYEQRKMLYRKFADLTFDNSGSAEETAEQILEAISCEDF